MGTYNTTFCLVNLSGRSISSTSVAIDDPDDWDYVTDENKNRPDLNLGGGLDSNNARCEREEINAGTSKGCWFTVGLDFIGLPEPLPKMEFKVNQWDYIPDQIMDLTLLSNAANPQMPKALKDLPNVRPKVHPNIVYIDNVDPWLCTPIINLNYG